MFLEGRLQAVVCLRLLERDGGVNHTKQLLERCPAACRHDYQISWSVGYSARAETTTGTEQVNVLINAHQQTEPYAKDNPGVCTHRLHTYVRGVYGTQ